MSLGLLAARSDLGLDGFERANRFQSAVPVLREVSRVEVLALQGLCPQIFSSLIT